MVGKTGLFGAAMMPLGMRKDYNRAAWLVAGALANIGRAYRNHDARIRAVVRFYHREFG
jgi:hypothetical protein